MKIEKLDQSVYHLSETTSMHSITLTSSELIELFDFAQRNMKQLEAEAKEEQENGWYQDDWA